MNKYLIVVLGGGIGSLLRFWVGGYVSNRLGVRFPYGTFVINVSACFLIGFIMAVLAERTDVSPVWRYLLVIGFLGGYSTFSTFEYETLQVFQEGEFLIAALNVALSVFVGFAAVWIGAITGRRFA